MPLADTRGLKPGDRVRVYGHPAASSSFVGHVSARPTTGKWSEMGYVLVIPVGAERDTEELGLYCHPKQLRKLVKKERRRTWCWREGYENNEGPYVNELPSGDSSNWIEFIEVRCK